MSKHHRIEHDSRRQHDQGEAEDERRWCDTRERKRGKDRHDHLYRPSGRQQALGSSLRHLRAASSRDLTRFGLVVFARVRYAEDETAYKIRPVVVVGASADGSQVYARPISSSQQGLRLGLALSDWESAGLSRPCAVQHRVVTLCAAEDFSYTAGSLTPMDAYRVEQLMVDLAA